MQGEDDLNLMFQIICTLKRVPIVLALQGVNAHF